MRYSIPHPIWLFNLHDNFPDTGGYQLIEFYCADPTCDCNRVIIAAMDRADPGEGTIISVGYAFDRNDPKPGPYIDPLNPVTNVGRSLYPMISEMLKTDVEWVARLKRHYKMVKEKIKSKKSRSIHWSDQTVNGPGWRTKYYLNKHFQI